MAAQKEAGSDPVNRQLREYVYGLARPQRDLWVGQLCASEVGSMAMILAGAYAVGLETNLGAALFGVGISFNVGFKLIAEHLGHRKDI